MAESINNEQLALASQLAIGRLARYASRKEHEVSQSFLICGEYFSGIRFLAGAFVAEFRFTDEFVEFRRGDQMIDRVFLKPDQEVRRAA